ncbi:MAG: thioredoxin-dependent thiol peroxidase [Verrucomicrobia bacterium]|nr:thioredoxin-dependent thiol peroxidase [Verrucomicrobiota bacterium]MDA1087307.1 thioredoxin-dependent thiol peroxidase [Verrucomicrobiota bacterium]
MIKAGDKAPSFTLTDQNGDKVAMKDFDGQKVAIYFYPKDDTPGCTKQACSIRDDYRKVSKAGIVILGISPDDEKKHRRFVDKYDLPFTLLADPDKKALQKYGVWQEKSMYGRKYMGVVRTTFLIDEKGKVVSVIEKPKVANHAGEILDGFGA